MRPVFVVVRLKIRQLVLQVMGAPEHSVIQKLPANGTVQSILLFRFIDVAMNHSAWVPRTKPGR
jgi:hypothetical protein